MSGDDGNGGGETSAPPPAPAPVPVVAVASEAVITRTRVDYCTYKYVGKLDIKPRVINQHDYSDGCCSYCAFANSLRMGNLVKWYNRNKELFRKHKDSEVDIRYLIKTFMPPSNLSKLLSRVIQELEGDVKAEGTEERPFHLGSYEPVGMGCEKDSDSPAFEERFRKIEDHLQANGAVVGSMYLRLDFKPHLNKVYAGDLDYFHSSPDIAPIRHAVCIVGTADALHRGQKKKAFIYLESEEPKLMTHDRSGFAFMLAKAMHRVYLLKV